MGDFPVPNWGQSPTPDEDVSICLPASSNTPADVLRANPRRRVDELSLVARGRTGADGETRQRWLPGRRPCGRRSPSVVWFADDRLKEQLSAVEELQHHSMIPTQTEQDYMESCIYIYTHIL